MTNDECRMTNGTAQAAQFSSFVIQKTGAPQVSPKRPVFERMALSRILSPSLARRVMIISLTRARKRASRRHEPKPAPPRRLLPGGCPAEAERARRRASCYVLHRSRFFVPRALLRGRWALTPPFHPYPQPLLRGTVGGLFSVTLSVAPGFRPSRPRILHGLLPGGVRTFLSRANRERSSAIRRTA